MSPQADVARKLRIYTAMRYGGAVAIFLCIGASRLDEQTWDFWVVPTCIAVGVAYWGKRSQLRLKRSLEEARPTNE